MGKRGHHEDTRTTEKSEVSHPQGGSYNIRYFKIIRRLDSTTATGIDTIPPKLVKMACDIIAQPLINLIDSTVIDYHLFPLREKVATVTPIFRKDDKLSKKNYRPISVLNVFSKVFERYILNQMMPFFDKIQSKSPLIDLDTFCSIYY